MNFNNNFSVFLFKCVFDYIFEIEEFVLFVNYGVVISCLVYD